MNASWESKVFREKYTTMVRNVKDVLAYEKTW